ncbi:MAG: ureidoglycolate lyase [Spirochaetaceae bacterium]
MDKRMLELKEINVENAKGYGTLIDNSGTEPTADFTQFAFWNELAEDELSGTVAYGMVQSKPEGLTATTLERHVHTTELLAPLDGDVILIMGKPTSGDTPNPDAVGAFRLPQGKAFIFNKGTWHFAPLAERHPVHNLIMFRKGTPDDDLEAHDLQQERNIVFEVTSASV